MQVIAEGNYGWYLLMENTEFYMEVLCSHGAVDYIVAINLNPEEVRGYLASGKDFLDKLAYEIHYSAPGVIGSSSKFRERKLDRVYCDKLTQAIDDWNRNSKT